MANTLKNSEQKLLQNSEPSFLTRVLDLAVSGLGLLLLAPVFLVIGPIIKFTSAGPIFHKMERVGKGGQIFKLYNFRSLYLNADQYGLPIFTKDDARIAPVGRFLRQTKLNKLPQLINVLRGEMSLIGPRPQNPQYVAFYTPQQQQLLAVRPGIISPASLHYQTEETLLTEKNWETVYREQILPNQVALELAYLQRRNLWTDLNLIRQTLAIVVHSKECFTAVLHMRNRHIFLLDVLALLLIPALALTLRVDGLGWLPEAIPALIFFTGVALLVKFPVFYWQGLYCRYWRHAGISDLTQILIAIGLTTLILTTLFIGTHSMLMQYKLAMYRAVPLIDGLLTLLAVGGYRVALRGLHHWHRQGKRVVGGRRVLIVGADETGTMAVREIRANPQLDMEPAAFVDDDPAKIGTQIEGLPVLGHSEDIAKLVNQYHIQRVIIATPSIPFRRRQAIATVCQHTGVAIHNLPGIYQILAGHKTISSSPKININQLLHRQPIDIDLTEVAAALSQATVLVTGAGGSIGSELCRQIARLNPARIILLGHGENSIFEIELNLRLSFPNLITHQAIVDVRDKKGVSWVVKKYRPQVIFHAAAHKHVHLMETNMRDSIINNILGTQNIVRAAEQHNVERLILISTDKAINPTSIMGLTKRTAELLVVAAAQRLRRAYVAVRFGNVLGSRGSVIPVFQRQIAAGGPLTITHPDMYRYFMTIPEAVQLVLQAMVLGRGGEVFMLDMGKPVRILDLATDLIKLSGLEPGRDIKIVYSGIRPGEKLCEEIFLESENYQRTKHQKIFVSTSKNSTAPEVLDSIVANSISLAEQMQPGAAIKQMQAIIPEYQPHPLSKPAITPEVSLPTPHQPMPARV